MPNSQVQQDIKRWIAEFRPIDDTFMTVLFQDIKCTEHLLEIILDKHLRVSSVHTQEKLTNPNGRTVCLDILAEDNSKKKYNIEIQRSSEGANIKRARYHRSMVDISAAEKGQLFQNIPDIYIIFITEHDVFKEDFPLYHIVSTILETGDIIDDGTHIIYVNASYQDQESALGRLLHDFFCADSDCMLDPILAERVKYLKCTKEGEEKMCRISEEMIKFGEARGRAEGKAEGKVEGRAETNEKAVYKMLQMHFPLEQIAEILSLSIEEVNAIIASPAEEPDA